MPGKHKCSYVKDSGKQCGSLVAEEGGRCRVHTEEGLRQIHEQTVALYAKERAERMLSLDRELVQRGVQLREHEQSVRALRDEEEALRRSIGAKRYEMDALATDVERMQLRTDIADKQRMLMELDDAHKRQLAEARADLRQQAIDAEKEVAEKLAQLDAKRRCMALLAKADEALSRDSVGEESRAYADSCRETAKELRLFATYSEQGYTGKPREPTGNAKSKHKYPRDFFPS